MQKLFAQKITIKSNLGKIDQWSNGTKENYEKKDITVIQYFERSEEEEPYT